MPLKATKKQKGFTLSLAVTFLKKLQEGGGGQIDPPGFLGLKPIFSLALLLLFLSLLLLLLLL